MKKVLDAILDWPEKALYCFALLIHRLVIIVLLVAGVAGAWMLHPVIALVTAPLLLVFLGVQWTPQESRRE